MNRTKNVQKGAKPGPGHAEDMQAWTAEAIDQAETTAIKRAMGEGHGQAAYVRIKKYFDHVRRVKQDAV